MRRLIVQIPQPCHERWSEMEPTEQGRFCASCQKTVVDYTALTDQQLIRVLSQPLATSCGRFRNEQLNRPLHPPKSDTSSFWPHWVSLLTAGLFGWQTARAQVDRSSNSSQATHAQPTDTRPTFSVKAIPPPISPVAPTSWTISGKMITEDSSGHQSAVPQAYVTISGAGRSWLTQTDSSGFFTLAVPKQQLPTELTIRGCTAYHQLTGQLIIQVSPAATSIRISDLMVYGSRPMRNITGGGIALVQAPSRWQRLKRRLFR